MRNANSSEQLVVVGPSMGGQIARFALAYMEKRYNDPNDVVAYQKVEWRHNVRLYFSLDSPHNGANIPLGLQHFVNIFAAATKETDLVAGLAELNSPAARQLTLQHHTQGTASLPDPLRTSFVNTLSSLGNFPSQLRRIAVTNGSLNGIRQSDQNGQIIRAGERAFFLEQRGIPCCGTGGVIARLLWPIAAIARTITTASAKVYYAPEYGQLSQVTRTYLFQPGSYHGERTRDAIGLSGTCSLDGAPGGYRGFFNSFVNGTYRGDPFEKFTIYSPRDKACFIPTLSGLAYNQPADNCTAPGQNLVCNGTTPFDAYYGPLNRNEDHIQLTPGNVEFMRNEILRRTPTPVSTAATTQLCPNSGEVTFSISGECPANRPSQPQPTTTYAWTAGSGLQIISGQGTPSVRVQPNSGFTGTTTLQVVATRAGNAASVPLIYQVTVAAPEARGTYTCTGCNSATLELVTVNDVPEGRVTLNITSPTSTDFVFGVSSRYFSIIKTGPRSAYFDMGPYSDPNKAGVTVTITPTDGCTSVSNRVFRKPSSYGFTYSPNPASDELTVTAVDTGQADPGHASTTAPPFEAALYDNHGKKVKGEKSDKGKAKLNVRDLPAGLYNLRAGQGKEAISEHIQVVH